MRRNHSAAPLSPKLANAADARAIFNYLFKKARLWPEYKISPPKGEVRRVVLFSEGFNDKTVQLLEQIPDIKTQCRAIEEIRLVCNKITPGGVERLKQIFPNSEVNVVPYDEWVRNVNTGNPEFDLKSGKVENSSNPGHA